MSLTNFDELCEHFGIDKDDCKTLTVFNSKDIEKIGRMIAWELAKGKGRVIIDYDPAYPEAAKRTYTDTPNTPDYCYKVTWNEGEERFSFEPVPPTNQED